MAARKEVKQFDVWIVEFDPSIGSEINKRRPGVVVSNNIINDLYATVIVAPITSSVRNFPSRVDTDFEGNGGQIAVDQLKCFDKSRLKKWIGRVSGVEEKELLEILKFIFEPEK